MTALHRRSFITGLVSLVAVCSPAWSSDDWTTSGTGSLAFTQSKSCWIASIAESDKAVTIDWECVEVFAKRYREGTATGYNDSIAHVLKAIRDGKAASK